MTEPLSTWVLHDDLLLVAEPRLSDEGPERLRAGHAAGARLTLSGHTHGGQIRLPNGPPLIRQSRYCLDEGLYAFDSSLLIVSRGIGSVLLPWRWGADPEALWIEIVPTP